VGCFRTLKTLHQLAKQSKLIKDLILDALQNSMDHVNKVSKSFGQTIAKVVLLETRVAELENTITHFNKKERRFKVRLPVPAT
jgi:hypothetical protein